MTGGFSQYARTSASLDSETPLADRWDAPVLVNARCIPVDSDKITTMTAEQWNEFVALKYGRDEGSV